AGQVLVKLVPRDLQAALDQARAQLAVAETDAQSAGVDVPRTQLNTQSGTSTAGAQLAESQADLMRAESTYEQAQTSDLAWAQANIAKSKANAQLAQADLDRCRPLMEKGEISKQQFDAAQANADATASALKADQEKLAQAQRGVEIAKAQLEAAKAHVDQARAGIISARADTRQVVMRQADAKGKIAKVQQAQAALEGAQLNLEYTTIVAPVDGVVTHKQVERGQIVQQGQGLMVVVPLQDVWITANFKETHGNVVKILTQERILRRSVKDRLLAKLRMPDGSIKPWVIAITVTLATFMEVLDTSIANVALPHISGNLSASADESTWVLTSYLVSNAIVLPLSGWLSGLIGRKRFYMSCVALFTVSSFLCGLAPSLGVLVLFRILQGIGGGGLQPSEQAILNDTFSVEKRGMAFAVYGIAVVVAPTIGPWLGGWITDNFSWRWIFYINVPVGIISLLLTSVLISDPPYMKRASLKSGFRIDYIGIGLISLGLGSMQIILDKGQREDWLSSNFIRVFFVMMLVGLIAGILW